MEKQTLKYELTHDVVNYLLEACNSRQIRGVTEAQNLISVVNILKKPSNSEDLQKDEYEKLKNKFDPKKEEKKAK